MTEELKHKIHKEATKYVEDDRRVTRSEYTAYLAGAEAMYAELAPLVEWISVEDRFPSSKNYEYERTLWKDANGRIWFGSATVSDKPTHWRRIEL